MRRARKDRRARAGQCRSLPGNKLWAILPYISRGSHCASHAVPPEECAGEAEDAKAWCGLPMRGMRRLGGYANQEHRRPPSSPARGVPPPPSRAPSLCPADVPLTASATLNDTCTRK